MFRRLLIMLAAAALTVGAARTARAAQVEPTPPTVTLRVATLAPAESPWGKVFKAWQKGIKEESKGALEIQFFYGNQQGDEVAMVGKMRTGQLDGAAITATGLAQIYKPVLVLQLPGLYRDRGVLDAARVSMRKTLDEEFEKQRFKIVGWGDVGIAHLMTKGFDVKSPADLKHKNCFYLSGDPIEPAFYSLVGDVTPKQLTVPEILPALTANTINVVNAPSLAAEQLQWSSLLDHMNTQASGIGIGALVFAAPKINGLPADLKALVLTSGNKAGDALTNSIRNKDKEAFERLKGKMTTYEPTAAEQDQWRKLFGETRARLRASGTFDVKLFDRAVECSKDANAGGCKG
jgi:TRAP-type C4-dicarboxylate transport system substrate-binding protein